ncbi:MAG: citrate synthase [Candidatus Omnitrophica bacterium]|nr:citrate synthase [Candidatus Omnitrophota bacterium]
MQKEETSFSKGLEGVVAAQTFLSHVAGQEGRLFYRGLEIYDLAKYSAFPETCYLLLYGNLATKPELDRFTQEMTRARALPEGFLGLLKTLPKNLHPMAMLRTAVSLLASFDPDADNLSREALLAKGIRLTSQMPTLIAAFERLRRGKEPVAPDASLDHAANFLYMLSGNRPSPAHAKALDAYLILLADHGLNASTFSARVTVATLSDYYSGITSAIGTLKGDLHGSANQRAMEMFLEIGEIGKVEAYVQGLLANHKKVMGFGHRIYKTEDPRATVFRQIAKDLCTGPAEKWYQISEKIAEIVQREKKIYCNVDFYSASVLYTIGIPVDLFTTVFAMSRVIGWSAHIIEQLADNRLIRPQAEYVGPVNQSYVPLERR